MRNSPQSIEKRRIEGIIRELRNVFDTDSIRDASAVKQEMTAALLANEIALNGEELTHVLELVPNKNYRSFQVGGEVINLPESYFFALIKSVALFKGKAGRLPKIADVATMARQNDSKILSQVNGKIAPKKFAGLREKLFFSAPKPSKKDEENESPIK